MVLTLVLLGSLFFYNIAHTQPSYKSQADPWCDFDDDGDIDEDDLWHFCDSFIDYWKTGTLPIINKTAKLLELQAKVNSLNASLLDLEAYLETRITDLNASVVGLQSKTDILEARIGALEANYSVTNLKLAPNAIPFKSTFTSLSSATTEIYNWIDMAGMSLTISLNRTSHLLIMFSTEAYDDDWASRILVRALVGGVEAKPGYVDLTAYDWEWGLHRHTIDIMSYSYNFYQPSMSAGTYTVKMQWKVTGGTGYVFHRTLTVIALPA